jgi:hypothetical protein
LHKSWSTLSVPLSDPSRNRTRPDTQLQIEGRKKWARPHCYVKFCTLTHKILLVLSSIVASCYYNCCTNGSTSPGSYGYPLVCIGCI